MNQRCFGQRPGWRTPPRAQARRVHRCFSANPWTAIRCVCPVCQMERLFAPPDQPFWRVSTDCRPKRSNPTGSWVACSSVKSSLISSLNTWMSFGASIPSFTWDPRMDRMVISTSSPMTIFSSAFRDNIRIFSSLCWLD